MPLLKKFFTTHFCNLVFYRQARTNVPSPNQCSAIHTKELKHIDPHLIYYRLHGLGWNYRGCSQQSTESSLLLCSRLDLGAYSAAV